MVSDKFKLQFIHYLSKLLKEGEFTATYKFCFINALADLCIEQPLTEKLILSTEQITEKMIELYWNQSKPFSGQDKFILQNSGKQSAIIRKIIDKQNSGYKLGIFQRDIIEYNKFVRSLIPTVVKGPLWRLQKISNDTDQFLYKEHQGNTSIELNENIQLCFQLFYDLVISLTRNRWQQKIRSIPLNFELVGKKGDLENFLFGTSRKSLKKAADVFEEVQKGICFYCDKKLNISKAVDHFIPWSLYPYDLGHNFVLAHEKCNLKKSDNLASLIYFEKWNEKNIIEFSEEITERLSPYFLCDPSRSLAIANWAYTTVI